ncbi:MAG TPA: MFS transporter [Candidatus Egerieousia sp.]|nr:MFS transporter [Candidatus Egerieousia sp.]HPT05878.1 MFS transporter [Candidatus Egerieousia sp.]
MEKAIKLLRDSKSARWLVLACLVVPMFASYFFDDMFSTVSHIFKTPEFVQLAWNSQDYGFYAGGYSFLCVWGGLIICGMLLDKWGVRFTGSLFVAMMVGGAGIVAYAISGSFNGSGLHNWMAGFTAKPSLVLAYIGCTLFGLGSEIAGVAVTRSIAKWFKGKEMALAMGLQLSIARLGTALAFVFAPTLVGLTDAPGKFYSFADTGKPALIGLGIMAVGIVLWSLFITMDFRLDKQTGETDKKDIKEEDKFKFSDIFKILTNKHYILVSLLCVFFYCCIISFKKFGTSILIPRFGIDLEVAKWMIAMIPFFTVIFTPLFGSLVDHRGKGTTWMILGSCVVLIAHILICFAPGGSHFCGYAAIALLGVGYSLVPAAMWPSIPKIIPEKNLGSAYSLIYWIQNMGMLLVPIFVGGILKRYIIDANNVSQQVSAAVHAEYLFIGLGIVAVTVSILLAKSSKKNPQLHLDDPNKVKNAA